MLLEIQIVFLGSNIPIFRLLAVITLAAWVGAYHHDAWGELIGKEHHHVTHASADHHGHTHHGHTHHGEDDHGHQDSIPLPDTHTDPISPGTSKIGVGGPKLLDVGTSWLLLTIGILVPESISSGCEHPPPIGKSDLNPPALILLAHSVQSNAPPVLS